VHNQTYLVELLLLISYYTRTGQLHPTAHARYKSTHADNRQHSHCVNCQSKVNTC